jgi:hypothetical protein
VEAIDVDVIASALKALSDAGFVKWQPEDENVLRTRVKLPPRDKPRDPEEEAQVSVIPPDGDGSPGTSVSGDEDVDDDVADEAEDEEDSKGRTLSKPRKRGRRSGRRERWKRLNMALASRNPRGAEIYLDLRGVQDRIDSIADEFMRETQGMRDEFVSRLSEIASTTDADAMLALNLGLPSEFRVALFERLRTASRFGAGEVRRELSEQMAARAKRLDLGDGLGIDASAGAELRSTQEAIDEWLIGIAAFVAAREGARYREEAAGVLISVPAGISAEALPIVLKENLEELSGKALRAEVATWLDQSYSHGRHVGAAEAIRDGVPVGTGMYSSIRDRNVCENCRPLDGEHHDVGDANYLTPNPNCLGGRRCRCGTIYEVT